ncbi:MAG: hypothetical protein ACO21N_10755 [Candidatus Nanopelagicales bacterium]|jgi:hypothetical protein
MSQQKPKPALSRAPDADLHPVSGRPLPAAIPGGVKDGEGKSKAKSLKPGKGASAADAITGPSKDKYVDLGSRVPKSVRKRLRAEAKAQGITVDDLVARILDAYLP